LEDMVAAEAAAINITQGPFGTQHPKFIIRKEAEVSKEAGSSTGREP
jgi:adenylosuccinate synthase